MIRRKILTTLLLVAVVLSAGYAGLAIAADSGDPGSRLDPLVTKSFVEQYVEKYVKEALNTAPSSDFQWRIKTVAAGQVFTGGSRHRIYCSLRKRSNRRPGWKRHSGSYRRDKRGQRTSGRP